jgi:hypothetical protein
MMLRASRAAGLLAGGCVVLLLLAGARPAAAEGQAQPVHYACKTAAKDNVTVIKLLTSDSRQVMLYLHLRDSGEIRGKLYASPAHPKESAWRGSVEGEVLPNGGIVLRVSFETPPYEGQRLVIAGTLREGAGSGELLTYPAVTWHAQTMPGCPKWPEDVFRKELAQSAEAQAEAGVAALAAANPLYACDMSSWSSTQQGSLGHQFVTDCAKKAATTLPWATPTGPGSLAWKACEAALNNRVSAVVEAMRPTCDKEERMAAAKNRCIPIHTTSDGKIYQNVPGPFSTEGKDVQLCMNEVQACFDRNADKAGQDSCATRVAGCFNFRTKGARASAANPFCLYTPPSSGAITTRVPPVPSRNDWFAQIGRPDNSLVTGTPYAGLGVTISGCSLPNLANASSALARRLSFVSLDRTDRLWSSVAFSDMQPTALALGDWCAPRTSSPAAAIPVVKIPSGGRIPPVTNRPAPQGSSGTNLATPGRGQPSGGTNPVRGGSGGGGTSAAMDRLGGGPSGGDSPAYRGGVPVKRSPAGGSIQSGGGTSGPMNRPVGGPSGGETPVYSRGTPLQGMGGTGSGAPPKVFGRGGGGSGGDGSTDYGFSSRPASRPLR